MALVLTMSVDVTEEECKSRALVARVKLINLYNEKARTLDAVAFDRWKRDEYCPMTAAITMAAVAGSNPEERMRLLGLSEDSEELGILDLTTCFNAEKVICLQKT